MGDEPILVVDDNQTIANFLASSLLPDLGYQTRVAYSGKAALDILREHPVSLIILDFQLADTNGLEILRQLRNDGFDIPAILMTAEGSEKIAVEAFRLGVQDYLVKPIDVESLDETITRALTASRLRKEKERLTGLLKERVSWLTVLSRIGRSVTSTLQLSEVLHRIIEAAVYLTRSEEGFIALLDDGNQQLYLRAMKNIDEELCHDFRLPVGDPLIARAISTRLPLRIMSAQNGLPIKIRTGFLVQSLIHVPILSKDKVLGVLSVANQEKRQPFSERDEDLLASLADFAAVAIENARLFEQAQREIFERKRTEAALRESEERYALALNGANDGLWDWDLKTNKIYFSSRLKSLLGFEEDEIGSSPEEWFGRIHAEHIEQVKLEISSHLQGKNSHLEIEHRVLHKDGNYRWMLARGLAVRDEDSAHRMAGSLSDITDRKNAEEKLLRDAFYDTLTGLPNRALFLDRLRTAIERGKRHPDYQYAVLFLDLDRFKNVNDSLGHLIGDQLLIAIAHQLQGRLRATDTVARLGGDEFVIVLEDIREPEDAIQIADWILEQLSRSFHLGGHDIYISASIGIILDKDGYQSPDEVLRDADIAMYVAKAHGKGCLEVFHPEMRARILDQVSLETDLRQAIESEQFQIFYQPIVSLLEGRLTGFEALVRWDHPMRGLLQPSDFVPLAEETGLIGLIDRWVLRQACRKMHEWQLRFPEALPLAINVNISGKEIKELDLVYQVEKILQETGLDSGSLRLEITESALIENDSQSVDVLTTLQSHGVQVQIDDFGTGFSSLGYLHQFPFTALKIDRTFIRRLGKNAENSDIVNSLVVLAKALQIETIAEGIETPEQYDKVRSLGCHFGQGFFISSPLPGVDADRLLSDIRANQHSLPLAVMKATM